ncbi:hypothetical protein J4Q44_G00123290 [Coregonus suidteri]|uniref:Reverse transcriptase/retrotransposon-derived protein RNase H-like domain-containing protein n=1 Tax=Coregonus suidteri TaxID=861788 RepID=A0AAN8LWH9_9TELE
MKDTDTQDRANEDATPTPSSEHEDDNSLGYTECRNCGKLAKIQAITQLELPSNVIDLRSILSIIHNLGRDLPVQADVIKPFNNLLKRDATWTWSAVQEEAFKKVKQLVTESPAPAFYDMTKPTIVSADASSSGLGGVLLQKHDGQLKPVA